MTNRSRSSSHGPLRSSSWAAWKRYFRTQRPSKSVKHGRASISIPYRRSASGRWGSSVVLAFYNSWRSTWNPNSFKSRPTTLFFATVFMTNAWPSLQVKLWSHRCFY